MNVRHAELKALQVGQASSLSWTAAQVGQASSLSSVACLSRRHSTIERNGRLKACSTARRIGFLVVVIPALAMILSASLLNSATAFGDDEKIQQAELPKLTDMQLPSADELLKADEEDKEFDWVVLVNQAETERRVIVVNPIFPRPDTILKLAEEYRQVDNSKPQNADEREKRIIRLKELQRILVTLPGNFVTEYALPVNQIDRIILFEDLMLQRVDQLLNAGEIRKAYEILLQVENEIPNWEKSVPLHERLMLIESTQRAQAGDIYAALALLDEVAERNINNPELRPRLGQIVAPMIDEALSNEDFRRARYLIGRVRRVFPDHELMSQANDRMQKLAADVMYQASLKTEQKQFAEAADLAWQAESAWPSAGNARATFARCVARHQVLRVAVEDFDGQKLVFPSPRESLERLSELVEVPLFEPSSADELTYFRSSYFELWDPTDLGREVVFSLRETRPYWQSQRMLTANDIAEALGQRIDPALPLFSPRLASFVREISVRSPSELRIRFSRVPLSIESLLRFPATGRPAQASGGREPSEDSSPADNPDGNETTTSADTHAPVVLSTRFTQVRSDPSGRSFVRRQPEPDGLDPSQYHVAEIRERSFTDRSTLLQAVIRGEIDYLPHLLPWEVDAFKASGDFDTKPYAIPITHVIAFNPMSERITSAQMRRALSFAVNREEILRSIVLQDESMRYGRPTSAAWHLGSYATNPGEQIPEFNLRLAFTMRYAAERQLQLTELKRLLDAAKAEAKQNGTTIGTTQFMKETKVDYIKLPRLRFVVEPDPTAIAAAERIMVYWQKIGIEVDLIPGDRPGETLTDADWDLCYRQVRMEEPLLELWPLLTNDTSFDVNRLALFPDWMRQELIGLDYAGSFLDAQSRLHDIHSRMAAQAFVIPLWEVDDFAVWRKSVIGTPDSPMSVYQNVERWIVRP